VVYVSAGISMFTFRGADFSLSTGEPRGLRHLEPELRLVEARNLELDDESSGVS